MKHCLLRYSQQEQAQAEFSRAWRPEELQRHVELRDCSRHRRDSPWGPQKAAYLQADEMKHAFRRTRH